MSGDVTFLDLINESKDRADLVGSSFVSDTYWKKYINKSKDSLYDLLIGAYGEDYYSTDHDITLVGGTYIYDLPTDFYKLDMVELDLGGGNYIPLDRFSRRNRRRSIYGRFHRYLRYRIINEKIHFTQDQAIGSTVKLWYIPLATNLVSDSDTLRGYNGWEEYIILDAAIKACRKEETDTVDLERDFNKIENRLIKMRYNRDAANPKRVQDVTSNYYNEGDEYYEGP